MVPGHLTKFQKLIEFVNQILPSLNEYSSLSSAKSKQIESGNSKGKTLNYHLPNLNKKTVNKTMLHNDQSPSYNGSSSYNQMSVKNNNVRLEKITNEKHTNKAVREVKVKNDLKTNIYNKKIKLQSIGIDFFRDSDDLEFDLNLKQILEKYQDPSYNAVIQLHENIEVNG